MRILVTGAGGLLGGRVASLLAADHQVIAAVHHAPAPAGLTTVPLDLDSPASIVAAVESARPEAVVHAAAFAEADLCEADPARAQRVNVDASAELARACRARGVRLVAFSTDLVFDGSRSFTAEHEIPAPLQAYGRSKAASEAVVLAEAPDAAVVRVALVLGRGHGRRGSASEAIAWSLGSGARLRLFDDQHRTPVDAESVTDLVRLLLARDGTGVFHAGGPERLSRHQLGLLVARTLELPADTIAAASQAAVTTPATRPADVSLACTRARDLGWTPRDPAAAILEGRRQRPVTTV